MARQQPKNPDSRWAELGLHPSSYFFSFSFLAFPVVSSPSYSAHSSNLGRTRFIWVKANKLTASQLETKSFFNPAALF